MSDLGRVLFHRAPLGGVVTSPEGVLLSVNPAFCEFLGYETDAELIGRHVRDITDPRDAEASSAGIRALIAGELSVFRQEKRYLTATGETVWARTSAARLCDADDHPIGVIAQMEQIGDQVLLAQQLVRSSALLRTIFDSSPIAKIALDMNGAVLAANPAMLTLTGRADAGQLSWSSLFSLTPPEQTSALRQILRRGHGAVELQSRIPRQGQYPAPVLMVAVATEATDGSPLLIVQVVDLTDQQSALAAAEYRAEHDELTGLSNRHHFTERLAAALDSPRRGRQRLALFMIDLDRFKQINDGLGHAAGDAVLIEVARRIEGTCRHADTVGRIGGDEFWVLARDIDDEFTAIQFAAGLLRALSPPFPLGGTGVHVGASIGFVLAPDDGSQPSELMRKADSAQYRAKNLRSGWAAYRTEIDDDRLDRLDLGLDLKAALDGDEIQVAYQPLFDTADRIRGFEALARWTHPTRGIISPDCFIPLAEQTHQMQALTRRVLRQALEQCSSWRRTGLLVSVAVNLAPSLLHDDSLPEMIQDELRYADLDAEHLTLEITEGRLADGSDTMVASALIALRDLGLRLSVDDFGTGYSSLSYLKTLPITELKIDRSFVRNIDADPRDAAIVRALVQLAKTLRLHVVAEGVESLDAARILRALGCDTLQGYVMGRPLTALAATSLLENHRPPSDAATPSRIGPRRPLRVLVVDQDPKLRNTLRLALEAEQHEVLEASTGEQALEAAADDRPDLVLLDHGLGEGLSGVETAVLLRSVHYDGPIILFSPALIEDLPAYRFPLDVWPVGKEDHDTLLELVQGCADAATRLPTAL